jgi:hypothetical protein
MRSQIRFDASVIGWPSEEERNLGKRIPPSGLMLIKPQEIRGCYIQPTPHSAGITAAGQGVRTRTRRKAMQKERPTPAPRQDRVDLDARYGEIGISAVAAAARYKAEWPKSSPDQVGYGARSLFIAPKSIFAPTD